MPSSRFTGSAPALVGKATEIEIASSLVGAGLYVFFPLVDAGFDLVVTNRKGTAYLPVQVKFRASNPALGLNPRECANFEGTNVVLVWIIGTGDDARRWFIPYKKWKERAIAPKRRKDGLVYLQISENEGWLRRFQGARGIQRSFSKLLK